MVDGQMGCPSFCGARFLSLTRGQNGRCLSLGVFRCLQSGVVVCGPLATGLRVKGSGFVWTAKVG